VKLKTRWKHLGGSVFENMNGTRMHIQGKVMVFGNSVRADTVQNMLFQPNYLKVFGGNRKRALMAIAEDLEVK